MEGIVMDRLCKSYGDKAVLRDFSAVLPLGETTSLMAPSGAGKTTLLRLLMGLEKPGSGRILGLEGLRLSAVFQEDRLCQWLSAPANIRLVNPRLEESAVEEALAAVGLAGTGGQRVEEFSGGMRRRVAILRALLAEYDLLLLDEPFRGLDEDTKALVMEDTRRRSAGRTVLLVTHDPVEAEAMADNHLVL